MEYTFDKKQIEENVEQYGFQVKWESNNSGLHIVDTGEHYTWSEISEILIGKQLEESEPEENCHMNTGLINSKTTPEQK